MLGAQSIRCADHVAFCDMADEVVLLDAKAGLYFGLNAVGATVWQRLQRPATLAELVDVVIAEYDVDHERAGQDVAVLVKELLDRDLIQAA